MSDQRRDPAQVLYLSNGFPFALLAFSNGLAFQQFNFLLELLVVSFCAPKLFFQLCKATFSTFLRIVLNARNLSAQSGADVAFRCNDSLGIT